MPIKNKLLAAADFLNLLDDDTRKLSPVKFNAWAANLGVFSTFVATLFAWTGAHVQGMEALWGGAMTWLTQAHTTHHFDKRERNISEARLIKAGEKDV